MPGPRSGANIALGALVGVATLGFARLFDDVSWALPVLLSVAGASAIGAATLRWSTPPALAASAAGLALLVANVVAGHTTFYGVPTRPTLGGLGRAWAAGIDAFRSAAAPAPVTPGLLLLGVGATWVSTTVAHWLAFRADASLAAVAPSFVLYAVGATLGTAGLAVPTTFAFVVTALIFVAAHHAAGLPTAWFAGRAPPPRLTRLALGAVPVAVVVGAAGLVLGPSLPGARAEAILELRGVGGGGDASRITVSPLVDIKPRLTSTPPVDLLTVRSPVPAYWRLTALEAFDGRSWSSRGTYRAVTGSLPGDASDDEFVYRIRQEFRLGVLDAFWLPAAYRPARIDLEGVRVNGESLALLTDKESANGLVYRVESEISRFSAADLAQAPPDVPTEVASYLELPEDFPDDVRALAREVTVGASGPYETARALQDHLRTNYRYDLDAPAGHSNDHLRYFLFRSRIGYCEQFAGAFAAMARSLGLPARVAVGFTPGSYDRALDAFRVTTDNAHAWPEVYFQGLGWVAFEPTPGRFEPNPTNYTGTLNPQVNPNQSDTPTPGQGDAGAGGPSRPQTPEETGGGFDRDPDRAGRRPSWLPAAAAVLASFVSAIAVPPALKRRRRWRRRAALGARARVVGAWAEAVDRLRELGAVPTAALTPLEFSGQVQVGAADVGVALTQLARLVTKAAYARGGPSEEEARSAWKEVEAITRALDSGDSLFGRWRRRLNPATLVTAHSIQGRG